MKKWLLVLLVLLVISLLPCCAWVHTLERSQEEADIINEGEEWFVNSGLPTAPTATPTVSVGNE